LTPAAIYVLVLFMLDAEAMTARHVSILAELAEIGMAISRELKTQALEAEEPQVRAQAVLAFPKVARAVRQSLALEARVQRDLVRHQREMTAAATRQAKERLTRRKAQVRFAVERAIEAACPDLEQLDDEAEARLEDLRERLDDDLLEPDFADMPFPEAVARLHRALGLDPPDDLGPEADTSADPDGGPDPDEAHDPPPAPPQAAPEPEPDFRYSSA